MNGTNSLESVAASLEGERRTNARENRTITKIQITFAEGGKVIVEEQFRRIDCLSSTRYEDTVFESKEEALAHISKIWGE